ncbi:kinase [Novosphingobium kaempferiae]|uniref:kinase n=1 Tax=Novosphingobium kaempferiae TaxID=2896849 RepID=UPI001E469210|nr:kinase [Novosphingobium kaempferiae]
MTPSAERVLAAVRVWLGEDRDGPLVLGLCGSQGSGKSTLAAALCSALKAEGRSIAVLSLDDLYLGHEARADLARTVHPLFATRGVPGTHDVAQGIALIDAIRAGQPVTLPRFDKARDEPAPEGQPVPGKRLAETENPASASPRHPRAGGDPTDASATGDVGRWVPACAGMTDKGASDQGRPLDLLIFEGWCVGAKPQDAAALAAPVNALEREEDVDAVWRNAVNAALAGPYADLFARIDRLVLLAAPGFEVVRGWRGQQEDELRARVAAGEAHGSRVMDGPALDRFVQHYERLTRHILTEMPPRADLVLRLEPDRSIALREPS